MEGEARTTARDLELRRVAGSAAAPIVPLWDRLARPTPRPDRFEPSLVADLPEAARRWLTHSIAPGARLARAVLLEMEGRFRLVRWLSFRAVQILAPPEGFVWAAHIRWGPLSIRGYDRYADDTGELRWRLGGLIPFIHTVGDDIARSSAGRLAAEAVLLPTACLRPGVTWHATADPHVASAVWSLGPRSCRTDVHVDDVGAVRKVTMMRWGNPNREPFDEYPFAAVLDGHSPFDGITIPTRLSVGWFYGTDRWSEGEFLRARVISARFL